MLRFFAVLERIERIWSVFSTLFGGNHPLLKNGFGRFNWVDMLRFFHTTSRSYREYIVRNAGLPGDVKEMLLSINLPKFVWVTEISDRSNFLSEKVNEVLLIDATADSDDGLEAIIDHINFSNSIHSFSNFKESK